MLRRTSKAERLLTWEKKKKGDKINYWNEFITNN